MCSLVGTPLSCSSLTIENPSRRARAGDPLVGPILMVFDRAERLAVTHCTRTAQCLAIRSLRSALDCLPSSPYRSTLISRVRPFLPPALDR
uniref:Uncharacterized protein n=2 Tax=Picea TaxID=3328 RepID=A0A117NI66_PICGL|nr:hypothetical protein ABT39_MTgene4039 [Picea glauca]QHR89738.1 hypothetical protein Q903MT_gene3760 [Picea sitchensis]